MTPRRFIATGAPGSGKTATLTHLLADVSVVREAASAVNDAMLTDGIEGPEREPDFLHRIVSIQRERRLAANGDVQLHDRSVFCTVALARFLGLAESPELADEVRATRGWFEPTVFFFAPLGFVTPTRIRRITYPDALRFGELHRAVYLEYGFELTEVAAASPADRAAFVRDVIDRQAGVGGR